jgi:hypothetical protein
MGWRGSRCSAGNSRRVLLLNPDHAMHAALATSDQVETQRDDSPVCEVLVEVFGTGREDSTNSLTRLVESLL